MKKNRAFLIPLILGVISMAAGLFFFAQICQLKDNVYKNYKVSLSDASIQEIFAGDGDEDAVR